jgi:hypothetical protein
MTTQRATLMRRTAQALVAVALFAGILAMTALPAGANVRGSNGCIIFGRFDPAVGNFHLSTVKPDGTDEVPLLPGVAECPRWGPDGDTILVCVTNPKGLLRPATLHSDGSDFMLLSALGQGHLRCILATSFTGVIFLPQVKLHIRPGTSVEELIMTTQLSAGATGCEGMLSRRVRVESLR